MFPDSPLLMGEAYCDEDYISTYTQTFTKLISSDDVLGS